MEPTTMAQKLDFVATHRAQDESVLLAEAVRAGIDALYRETVIDAYLTGKISREKALRTLDAEKLEKIEYQRDCLERDVEWGLRDV